MLKHSGVIKFQFQTGAIKSRRRGISIERASLFQFQTGAIKSKHSQHHRTRQRRFNSKLVRLKEVSGATWIRVASKFQFQTGAIKRTAGRRCCVRADRFQFQTGAIKRCFGFIRNGQTSHVSIPNWCD